MERLADHTGGSGDLATVAFIDLAGFSAITDVFGDAPAVRLLEVFESLVQETLGPGNRPVKWIGDETMLAFADPDIALQALGRLLPACRADERLPLTRAALNHGPVVRRENDVFGAMVNLTARLVARAEPGQMLATHAVAEAAAARGIAVHPLGPMTLRSLLRPVEVYSIELAPSADPAWIDPVCKMHAPWSAYRAEPPPGPWFCSEQCAEAYRASPETYPRREHRN
jgi:adenylate cyclase